MRYQVVYLTGAPASGKSTLLKGLQERRTDVSVFEYGARLTAYLQQLGKKGAMSQKDLRAKSAALVTPDDIKAVDEQLLEFVRERRPNSHVIIDSHAVTKEAYGFRVTPFSLTDFGQLAPSQIWVLYTSPSVTVSRIGASPDGRPFIDEADAAMHTGLQASVATTYGMSLGVPVHFFDSAGDPQDLLEMLAQRLGR